MDTWKIKKAENGLTGEVTPPPDKSISHRAVMFGAIAEGTCRISNFLKGEDCMSTLEAFRSLGISIDIEGDVVTVEGRGLKGLRPPRGELYLGNSGTTMRIISGILAGQDFSTVLTGDDSLSKRPMRRIMDPLKMMGADIEPASGEHAPLRINGTSSLRGIDYVMPVASAQVKSCLLLAGLYASGVTRVTEPFQSRDHTERMMECFSANIKREGLTTEISGDKELVPKDIFVPGDISSAAFFIVAALIVKGSELLIKNVGLNPTRTGIIDVLKRMGADIEVVSLRDDVEPAGDLRVRYSDLKGTEVTEEEVPLLIDEVPVLSLASAVAQGETRINGIKELKVKETDRVHTVVENFTRMGIEVKEENNALVISGGAGSFSSAVIDSFGDHRIAMTGAVAALVSDGECTINNASCADVSYPGFLSDLDSVRSQ